MAEIVDKAWRNDAHAKVSGRARYTDDLKFCDMLHAVPVYTDYVHARLNAIDTNEAEAMPGVVCVLTAKDIPGSVKWGQIQKDLPMLADDKIRYNGDVVAVVVAETREQALNAVDKVYVSATELPLVLDLEEAMKAGSPLLHEDKGSNIVVHHRVRRGQIKEGLQKADHILEAQFTTPFIEHAYLEPESAVCVPRPDGVMDIYGSMQHPFSTRRFTAAILGRPLADINVITVPMGGGFGGKDDTAAIVCARTALAAHITGQPVKMTYDREWSFRESYKRHPYVISYKMGIASDGLITGVEARMICDAGAYCSVTPWVTWRSTVQCCGPYKVPHIKADIYGVHSNNVYTGAMRGFGSPQVNFAIEQLVEMAAEQLGMDAVDFRLKNMLRQGDVTVTGQKLDNHTVSLEQVLNEVMDQIDYKKKLAKCKQNRQDDEASYGIGLAISYRGMSLGAEGVDTCAAIINVQADGSILLETGIHENGQGSESVMILTLAEALGIKKERIRYRQPSTSTIPDSGTTVASRGTLMGSGAVVKASEIIKDIFAETLADIYNCDKSTVFCRDDRVHYGEKGVLSFEDAVTLLYSSQNYPHALGTFRAPRVNWDEEDGQGNAYFTWVYSCQAVELTVNKASGKIKLLNVAAAHDVGKAVNRHGVLGQIYGGLAMGLGYGLTESVKAENGIIKSSNYHNYRIMRATDLPEMTVIIVENRDPNSPSGAKGVGEPALEITAPAVANALYRATGQRCMDLPALLQQSTKTAEDRTN